MIEAKSRLKQPIVSNAIDHAIPPRRHSAMYLMHKYWARKPSNVVNEYIQAYSREDDTVLDPFNGSGVTVLEATKLRRKAIGVDVDPFSIFLTKASAIQVNVDDMTSEMAKLEKRLKKKISKYYETNCDKCKKLTPVTQYEVDKNEITKKKYQCVHCDHKTTSKITTNDTARLKTINKQRIPHWVPKTKLMYNSRINITETMDVVDLFSHRNLIVLSILFDKIKNITDEDMRLVFRLVFSTALVQGSKLMARTEGSGPSWKLRGFWIPPRRYELNVWHYFCNAYNKVVKGKTESNQLIESTQHLSLHLGSATNMSFLKDASVDYVFTDPPYGDSVPYLELNRIWSAWLDEEPLFDNEVVITDSKDRKQKQSEKEYEKLIRLAYKEIYRVLKPEKYLTVTFHNTDIKLYNMMIRSAIIAGFDLEKSVYQPPSSVSVKAQMAPYGSAIGDYYIRFKKPKSENDGVTNIADSNVYENIVIDSVKKILAERGEPTASTHILNSYSYIYERLKEQGYLFTLDVSISDVINRHLGKEFVLVEKNNENMLWLNPKMHNFIDMVPLSDRVEKCIINELNKREAVTYDDLLHAVYLTFPNALTPTTYSIKDVLANYGEKTKDKKWRLQLNMKQIDSSHDTYVRRLCKLGIKYGFSVFGDVDGYRSDIQKLASEPKRLRRIREIDVIWYERNTIKYVFEVENSTGITEAIVRASNIAYHNKVKKIILIPASREELLVRKTKEPMLAKSLAEDPWLFVRYGDFDSFYDKKHKRSKSPKDVETLHKAPGTKPKQKHLTED